MRLEAGEEWGVEIGDYHFDFEGPVEITDADLEELRFQVEALMNTEKRIKKSQKMGRIGF